jgi:hypothetical protein
MRRLCLVAIMAAATGWSFAEELTYTDLIGRMTDLERLAVLPAVGETCAQWSSYDRASVYDAAKGEYVKWEANGDGSGFIRKEGTSQVLAEMEGPGVICAAGEGACEVLSRRHGDACDRPAVHRAVRPQESAV